MIKTYTTVGLATDKNGNTKVRYCNDLDQRLKILMRDGFTNLNFVTLPMSQTKITLCEHMLTLIQFQHDRAIIEKEIVDVKTRLKTISRRATLFSGSAEQLLEAIK